MNLSKKTISICKAIEAGELHLCPKCLKFKKSDNFNSHYWCKECKNAYMKKHNDELKWIDKVCECGKKVNIRSYNTHLKSNYHKRRLDMMKENDFKQVS